MKRLAPQAVLSEMFPKKVCFLLKYFFFVVDERKIFGERTWKDMNPHILLQRRTQPV